MNLLTLVDDKFVPALLAGISVISICIADSYVCNRLVSAMLPVMLLDWSALLTAILVADIVLVNICVVDK
jgi:hypothetical protein